MRRDLRDASRDVLAGLLILQRDRRLVLPQQRLEAAAAALLAAQSYDIVRAVHGAGDDVERALAVVLAALARRHAQDARQLARAYEPAILAALRELESRWNVRLEPDDLGAAAWADAHARATLQQLNETTAKRLRKPLEDSEDRDPVALAWTAALALVAMGAARSTLIGAHEALVAYAWSEGAAGAAYSAAGIGMLKEWFHTDACPCPHCTANDGVVVRFSDPFPSGAMSAPAHVNCRCIVYLHPAKARMLPPLVAGQTPDFSAEAA